MNGQFHLKDSSVKDVIFYFHEKFYHENIQSWLFVEGISYDTIRIDDAIEPEKYSRGRSMDSLEGHQRFSSKHPAK